jgi:hypothetical protein
MFAIADVVDQQSRRPCIVPNQHVHIAVIVDIAEGGTATDL